MKSKVEKIQKREIPLTPGSRRQSLRERGVNYLNGKINNFNYSDFFNSLLWAIIIALIFRTLLFEPFRIPSGSMLPNLQIGDYLFTSKYNYGYSKHSLPFSPPIFKGRIMAKMPERGDIIVFKGAKDPHIHYIKRLIGLPGDKIQLKRGALYLNGNLVPREANGSYQMTGKHGEQINYAQLLETLPNGARYKVLDANYDYHMSFPDETIEYEVPNGHFFFMGDNRNNSVDSRFLNQMGFIPFENLVGKAVFMFWTKDFSLVEFFTSFNTGRAFRVITDEN